MPLPEGSYTQTSYVVRDIEAAAHKWTRATGAGPWFTLAPETRNSVYRGRPTKARYQLALGFLGSSCLELIQPLDDEPSILSEILNLRGEGFHHVAPRLAGLSGTTFDARCQELEASGLKLAYSNEVVGLGRAAFYDALESIGGFIEVFELGRGYAMVPTMAELHREWDGNEPIRPMQSLF